MFKRLLASAAVLCLCVAPACAQFNGTNGIYALNSMQWATMPSSIAVASPGNALDPYPGSNPGGTGYAVNDTITLDCPNSQLFFGTQRPIVTVTSVNGAGGVTSVASANVGIANGLPSSGLAGTPNGVCNHTQFSTSGSGIGAVIFALYGPIAPFAQSLNTATIFGIVPVANGGTGANSLAAFVLQANLGVNVYTALQVAVGTPGAPVINGGAGGTPSGIVLTNGTGLPIGGISGLGTGVGAALAINIGTAGAPVLLNGAGGTPSAINLTNGTALPHGSITGLGTNVNTALGNATNAASGFPQLNASAQLPVTPVLGITGGTNACTGCLGEVFVSDVPAASAVSQPTSGTAITVTSFNLTAGDWDCWGMVSDNPAGTTTVSQMTGAINTTAATVPGTFAQYSINGIAVPAGQKIQSGVFRTRENITTTTTLYLVGSSVFATSTQSLWGHLECRREQ